MNRTTYDDVKAMVVTVAEALGPDLCDLTAFVGGATTGLLLTDELTEQSVRATDDVDLIVSALGYNENAEFEEVLRKKGFKDDMDSDVICRKKLGEMQVDFMPTDDSLGFTNRWYADALRTAQQYELKEGLFIRLVAPGYFIATKLEAFEGRGEGDILGSRDIEDIITLVDGRESLINEIAELEPAVIAAISSQISSIIEEYDFQLSVQSATLNNQERSDLVMSRFEEIVALTNDL